MPISEDEFDSRQGYGDDHLALSKAELRKVSLNSILNLFLIKHIY